MNKKLFYLTISMLLTVLLIGYSVNGMDSGRASRPRVPQRPDVIQVEQEVVFNLLNGQLRFAAGQGVLPTQVIRLVAGVDATAVINFEVLCQAAFNLLTSGYQGSSVQARLLNDAIVKYVNSLNQEALAELVREKPCADQAMRAENVGQGVLNCMIIPTITIQTAREVAAQAEERRGVESVVQAAAVAAGNLLRGPQIGHIASDIVLGRVSRVPGAAREAGQAAREQQQRRAQEEADAAFAQRLQAEEQAAREEEQRQAQEAQERARAAQQAEADARVVREVADLELAQRLQAEEQAAREKEQRQAQDAEALRRAQQEADAQAVQIEADIQVARAAQAEEDAQLAQRLHAEEQAAQPQQ